MKKVPVVIGIVSIVAAVGLFFGFSNSGRGVEAPIDDSDPRYQNGIIELPKSGSPKDYAAKDNIYISNYLYAQNSLNYQTSTTGDVTAKVTFVDYVQKVVNRKIVNEDEAFTEALSVSSMKSVGVQRYVTQSDYLTRKGSSVSMTGAKWPDSVTVLSKDDYLARYGGLPFSFTNYILNDLSIMNAELISSSNDTYVYEYTLDTEIAPARYSYEVMTMGGASGLPSFKESSVLTITMDSSWRILKVNQYEKYSIPLFGGITCTGELEEIFTYSDSNIDIPERSAFEPFFGANPTDTPVEEEKEAMDYLGEVFLPLLSSDSPLYLEGKINTNPTKSYDIKAKVGLKDMEFELLFENKLYAYLIGDDAVMKYNDIAVGVSKSELMESLSSYLPKNDDGSTSDITSMVSLESMGPLLENATVTKEGENVIITLPIEDILSVDLVLGSDENGTNYLSSIRGTMIKNTNYSFDIAVLNEAINFPVKPEEIATITNIEDIKNDVTSIIDNKAISLNFNFSIPTKDQKTLDISGDVEVDFNNTNNILARASIALVYGVDAYDIEISFLNNTVYLTYGENINIKLSIEDFEKLIKDVEEEFNLDLNPEVPSHDKEDLLSILKSIDIESLIKAINGDEEGFEVLFSLAQFELSEEVSLGYSLEEGFILNSSYGKVVINATSPLTLEEDKDITYIGYDEISAYITKINELVNSKRFDLTMDVNVYANGKLLSLNGNVLVDISNGLDFALEGTIAYGDILDTTEFSLKKIGDTYYLHFANSYFAMTQDEFMTFFGNLNIKYNLGLDSLFNNLVSSSTSQTSNILDKISIKDIIDSVCLGKELTLDFDASAFGYKNLDIRFDSTSGIISVASSDFVITLAKSDSIEQITKDENVVYETIRTLEQMQVTIEKLLEQKYYQGVISVDSFSGNLYVDISDLNNIYAYVKGTLTYLKENIDIYVEYKDGLISLASDTLGIKVSVSEVKEIIDLLDKEFNLGLNAKFVEVQEQGKDISIKDTLSSLINTLTITESSIKLTYVEESIGNIDIDVTLGNKPVLSINNDLFEVSVETTDKEVKVMPNTYYASASQVKTLISKVKTLTETKLFSISVNVSTLINNVKFDMSGNLSIDISNGLDLQGDFDIVYDSIRAQVEIAKLGDKLYLHTDSLNFTFSYGELKDFLKELNTRYKLGLDLSSLPETLDLPSTNKVDASSFKVISLVKMISLNESGVGINLDLATFGINFGKVQVNVPYTGNIANISNDHLSLDVDYGTALSFVPLTNSNEYLGYEDAIKVCNLVDNAIAQFKVNKASNDDGSVTYEEKTIHFTFDAKIYNTAINPSGPRFIAAADVYLKILTDGNLNLKLNLSVTGESNHIIDLTYVNNTIYCTYNGVNLAIEWKTLIQTLRYANDTFKFLDAGTADMVFGILGSTEGLDSTIFDSFMPSGESEPMLITNLLRSLVVTGETFTIKMNNDVIYNFETNYDTTGSIITNNNKITTIDIGYAYTSPTEYLSPRITFDELTIDEIAVPEGTYQKFDNLDSLLKSFVKSAELRNYDINGTINLKFVNLGVLDYIVNAIGETEVPVKAQIHVDENNAIKAHINMEIPNKASHTIAGSTLNMYIEDDMLYIHDNYYYKKSWLQWARMDSYEKWTVSEYFGRGKETTEDIIGLLHLSSTLENLILDAINEPKTTKPTFENSFVGYNSPNTETYNIILNGGDLASTEDIGNINLTLNSNSDGYLEKISKISVLMVKYIQLSANFNLVDGSIGNEVVVAQPDYSKY